MNAQPHNAIPYVIDTATRKTAVYVNNVIELHRTQLNDRDKARQMAANEREIAVDGRHAMNLPIPLTQVIGRLQDWRHERYICRLKDRLISATRRQPRDQVKARLYWNLMVSAINARSAAQIARMERRDGDAMNYVEFYPGDYMRDTAHLSLSEHGAYVLLLLHYYATEKPLPNDNPTLFRIARAMGETEKASVIAVADEFFPVDPVDGLRHSARADRETAKARARVDSARENGKKGGRPQKPKNNPTLLIR